MMLEEIIIRYLNDNGISAFAEVPQAPPERFAVIERTSGGRVNMINNARIAVQSYAPSLYAAAQLNETVKDVMLALPVLDDIGSCRLSADYNFTDTTTKRYRYQAIFDINYY